MMEARDQKKIDLVELPLFKGLKREEIEPLLSQLGARKKAYGKGDYLFDIGDPCSGFGIILSGSVQVFEDDYYGNRTIISSLEAGDMFGEAFAFAGLGEFPVSIQAICDTEVMLLTPARILTDNQLTRNMLGILAKKNMFLNKKVRLASHKTTAEKLMAFLNDQAKLHNSAEFTIPYDRQQLADYLGVERSAMSAELSKLQRQGVLKTERSHFILLQNL